MALLRLLEGVAVLLLLIVVATQIFVPFMRGTRYFPFFRRTPLTKEVKNLEEELAEVTEINEARERLREVSSRLRPPPDPPTEPK